MVLKNNQVGLAYVPNVCVNLSLWDLKTFLNLSIFDNSPRTGEYFRVGS